MKRQKPTSAAGSRLHSTSIAARVNSCPSQLKNICTLVCGVGTVSVGAGLIVEISIRRDLKGRERSTAFSPAIADENSAQDDNLNCARICNELDGSNVLRTALMAQFAEEFILLQRGSAPQQFEQWIF